MSARIGRRDLCGGVAVEPGMCGSQSGRLVSLVATRSEEQGSWGLLYPIGKWRLDPRGSFVMAAPVLCNQSNSSLRSSPPSYRTGFSLSFLKELIFCSNLHSTPSDALTDAVRGDTEGIVSAGISCGLNTPH